MKRKIMLGTRRLGLSGSLPSRSHASKFALHAATAFTAVALMTACSPTVSKHGHLLSQSDLQSVQPGASKEQVQTALGTPDTTSTAGGEAYYYISSTRKQVAFMKPEVVDRRVVAVYFDQFGPVENVARYGLKDGKIFDFISRETPTHTRDLGVIQKIFRGIGTPGAPPGAKKPGTI